MATRFQDADDASPVEELFTRDLEKRLWDYPGQWVVVSRSELLSVGESPEEAIARSPVPWVRPAHEAGNWEDGSAVMLYHVPISIRGLAERASVSPSYLSKLERGLKVPTLAVALRLANALTIPLEALWSPGANSHYSVRVVEITPGDPEAMVEVG